MERSGDHIMRLVREADPDRYLSALYAPEPKRADLLALYAFNAETASVRNRISEALPGEIRLQWWRDTLIAGEATGNPVADTLIDAIERHKLPLAAFENYLDARIFDLYDDPIADRTTLEGYCGDTASALIQLSSLILDPKAARSFADAAGHAGCAQAITGLIRLMPRHRARGQCYVPQEMLSAAGISREAYLSAEPGAAGGRVVSVMVAVAREHLAIFEREAGPLPQSLRPAFLPASLARHYLDAAERLEGRALSEETDISPLRRYWTLWRHAARGWKA